MADEKWSAAQVQNLTSVQLAKVIKQTDDTVRNLTKDGVLKHKRREDGTVVQGRYDLVESVGDYCDYLRGRLRLKSASQEDMSAEKLREQKAKADIMEVRALERRGMVHTSADIERVVGAQIIAFKQRMLRIPSAYSLQLANLNDAVRVEALLGGAIEDACRELAGYDPVAYRGGEVDAFAEEAEADDDT